MDAITNTLLGILILLIGWIGSTFYNKLNELLKKVEKILLSDVATKKDIEQLKIDRDDHEERLQKLER
jgi:hypothetical protein